MSATSSGFAAEAGWYDTRGHYKQRSNTALHIAHTQVVNLGVLHKTCYCYCLSKKGASVAVMIYVRHWYVGLGDMKVAIYICHLCTMHT